MGFRQPARDQLGDDVDGRWYVVILRFSARVRAR